MRYWRGPVLTNFDGKRWTVANTAPEIPMHLHRSANSALNSSLENQLDVNGNFAEPTDNVNYTVTLQPHKQRWLFALDTIQAAGRLLADGQLVSKDPITKALRYRQSSSLSDRLVPLIQPSLDSLQLAGRNTRTVAFAKELRQESESDQDFAQKVLSHFNQNPYRYTLKPQLLGDSPVDEFMFQTRSGFCEHYAAAFVVMMRSAGIHSRIVTGYQGGEMNEDYMIVRQSDAHAWAEAFIDGAWQRFDPTAAVAPSRVEKGVASALPVGDSLPRLARLDGGWIKDMQLHWDAMNHQWQRLIVDFDNDSQASLLDKLGLPKPQLWQITVGVMLAAALWCFIVLGLPSIASAKLSATEQAWQRLCRMLAGRGFTRKNSETPSDFLQRVAEAHPAQSQRLKTLQQAFSEIRFTSTDASAEQNALKMIHRELRALRLALHKARFSLAN